MTQMHKNRKKKKRQCKRTQGFKGEVYDRNAKERAHHTHQRCVLYRQKSKKKKRSMLHKATTNDGSDHQHHHQIVMGDILLHSGSKITVIQVVIQSLSTIPSLTPDKPIIHRLSPTSSRTNGSQTIVPCDLKNSSSAKEPHERIKTSSSKKLMRMHKAGLALVKEFKSKVTNPNSPEQKTLTINMTDDNERTHL